MKKMFAILMALLMAALLLPAYAEEGDVAEIAEIAGTVLEIGEESILLETPEGQLIEAILTADTIREGKEIAVGDFIHVMYNGQMTRSYPAQVTAQHIGCYVLTGTVPLGIRSTPSRKYENRPSTTRAMTIIVVSIGRFIERSVIFIVSPARGA